MSSNAFTITGRLGQDPELRFAQTGTAMCSVSIADQKSRKTDNGGWENASDPLWVRATVFKEAAEALAETARKGDEVIATGRLIARKWTDRDGVEQTSLELDFAKVGVVPRSRSAQRPQGAAQGSSALGDPWATNGPQNGAQTAPGGTQAGWADEPPFFAPRVEVVL